MHKADARSVMGLIFMGYIWHRKGFAGEREKQPKVKKKYIYTLLIACCSVLLIALITFDSISGTYVANHGIGADTIRIFPNHTYVRICYPKNDTIHYVDTGKWEASNGNISFYNWHDRNGLNHSSLSRSFIFITEIDRSWLIGRRRLLIDDDMGYYYIKDSWW